MKFDKTWKYLEDDQENLEWIIGYYWKKFICNNFAIVIQDIT